MGCQGKSLAKTLGGTSMNDDRYSSELERVEEISDVEKIDEELGYPEDHEYYEE